MNNPNDPHGVQPFKFTWHHYALLAFLVGMALWALLTPGYCDAGCQP
jgi:hypothetical protein